MKIKQTADVALRKHWISLTVLLVILISGFTIGGNFAQISVVNIDALRNVTGDLYIQNDARVGGYYTRDDGGWALRFWKAGAGQIDDGGQTIVPGPGIGTVSTAGAWVLPAGKIYSYLAYGGLVEAVTSIGATRTTILIDVVPPALTADLTIPPTLIIKFTEHMAWSGVGGNTLTVDSIIQAGAFRLFDSDFLIKFSNPVMVHADWWDKTYNRALKRAYDSLANGSFIKMSGGKWNIETFTMDLTTPVTGKTVTIEGIGEGYTYAGTQGTHIVYTGTGTAVIIGDRVSLSKIRISGGGNYGLQLGANISPTPWVGAVRDVYISGMAIAGVHAKAVQLGYVENLVCRGNGVGMFVSIPNNTLCEFVRSSFKNNTNQGVLYDDTAINSAFRYRSCDFESNGKEGVSAAVVSLTSTLFDGCWFENNYTSQTSGFYQLLLTGIGNSAVIVKNCHIRVASGTNEFCKFSGALTIEDNDYAAGGHTYTYGGVNATLITRDLLVGITDIIFSHNNNTYTNDTGRQQTLAVPSGSVEAHRLSNVSLTNAGAAGIVSLSLPPASAGLEFTFACIDPTRVDIIPNGGDQIIPGTVTPGVAISNATPALGDSITLRALDSVFWLVIEKTGDWL